MRDACDSRVGGRYLVAAAVTALALAAPPILQPSSALACGGANTLPTKGTVSVASRATVCLINERRRKHGLHALRRNATLHRAADRHSSYMSRTNCFLHKCPGEAGPYRRLRRAGYLKSGLTQWEYGEDIAWGLTKLGTPRQIVSAWMHSPEHRAEILHASFRDIGVGVVWDAPVVTTVAGGTYTADFGLRHG
jgi:uncharacterized protein YkwD